MAFGLSDAIFLLNRNLYEQRLSPVLRASMGDTGRKGLELNAASSLGLRLMSTASLRPARLSAEMPCMHLGLEAVSN